MYTTKKLTVGARKRSFQINCYNGVSEHVNNGRFILHPTLDYQVPHGQVPLRKRQPKISGTVIK